MGWHGIGVAVTRAFLGALLLASSAFGEESRFAATHSRSQYSHWIDLYDADGKRIDPTAPDALPYSPLHTCGRCHDYQAVAHGYHFNAQEMSNRAGRPGEPWIWTDTRTGTQIPLSYRPWPGTYDPRDLGLSEWDFVLQFGRQLPGGGPGEVAAAAAEDAGDAAGDKRPGRWDLSGPLRIDCMICHSRDPAYSPETWWGQISKQNFAWAPVAALGLADVAGSISELPEDFQPSTAAETEPEKGDEAPSTADAGPQLPRTTYKPMRMNAEKKIFFDVIRKPPNSACYYCHTTRVVGGGATAEWTHDEDVHLRAGMACADCHRNGIGHHTVRGYEGEEHPTKLDVATLSCRGCHLGEQTGDAFLPGGRLGAPRPLHRGLPPLHLEKLSCTACHSGPRPGDETLQLQTAMAHGLGLPSHHYEADLAPALAAPVMLQSDGVLYPHRAVWPAFWGQLKEDTITPLNPNEVRDALRRIIRVRRTSTFTKTFSDVRLTNDEKITALGEQRAAVAEEELKTDERAKLDALRTKKAAEAFRTKLADALKALKEVIKENGAEPVYIGGGRAYRLETEDKVTEFTHEAAAPYVWKLAHDVRPARWSSGATGCFECHSQGAPLFEGKVAAVGPAPDADPPTQQMYELAGYDKTKLDAWSRSFQGRTAFKWFGFASAGIVGLILISFVLLGVNGIFSVFRRS